jgi:hypothetical protein
MIPKVSFERPLWPCPSPFKINLLDLGEARFRKPRHECATLALKYRNLRTIEDRIAVRVYKLKTNG